MIRKFLRAAIGISVLIAVWQVAVTTGGFNPQLFPPPQKVLSGIHELIVTDMLWDSIVQSMLRFFSGYLSAVVLGMALGMYFGYFKGAWQFANPVAQILRPISPIAWLPFVVLWFGIGDIPAIVIVFIAAFFPVLLNTVSSVSKIDPTYFKLAKNFGLSRLDTFTKIIFPAAFPYIASGLHIAIGTAWVFIVAGEMVGAQSGLGFLIVDTRNNLRIDLLMSTMLIIGLLGLMLDGMVVYLERLIYKKWGAVSG
ncbi:MAG: ABC transporter permease [Zoogloeaceae bacterium]|jgi:NitT/TauT family transport system permease protein|nr:ABC transporter permease [Zoogloeaceae bacterium]